MLHCETDFVRSAADLRGDWLLAIELRGSLQIGFDKFAGSAVRAFVLVLPKSSNAGSLGSRLYFYF